MKQAHLYRQRLSRGARALLAVAAVSVCLLAAFILALNATKKRRAEDETQQLTTAIRRACVTCYAIEGRYPPNLAYITQQYGVVVDTGVYTVLYDAFAENLMPTVKVARREGVR